MHDFRDIYLTNEKELNEAIKAAEEAKAFLVGKIPVHMSEKNMRYAIPILTPNDTHLLFKYFSGIDLALSKRFALGFHPDEEHLTSLLCELLDENGAKLHALAYSVEQLNRDLAESGSLLTACISLKTTSYNKHQEGHFTQADIGIKIEYEDYIDSAASFEKGVLIQAKKLSPNSSGKFSLASHYNSFNDKQHQRIETLIKYYIDRINSGQNKSIDKHSILKNDCEDFFRYLLYNPPFSMLPMHDKEVAIHRQLSRDNSSIFDYLEGLHLYDILNNRSKNPDLLESSSLVVRARDIHSMAELSANSKNSTKEVAPFSLKTVIDTIDIRKESFPWYIVFQLIMGSSGCSIPELIEIVEGVSTGMSREMGVIPPRYTLKVRLVAGTSPNQCEKNA